MGAYTVGSLFSGIGGLDLGFERAGGFRVSWFCEADPFCRAVLAKHWPGVPCYEDVRAIHGLADAECDGGAVEPVDVLIGGFPCQDVSHAGKRAGLAGARSGLWSEFARLIGELRPRVAVMENVPGLFTLGIDTVLGDLAALGYDCEWATLRASDVGAPHRRERVFIVAYPCGAGHTQRIVQRGVRAEAERRDTWQTTDMGSAAVEHTNGTGLRVRWKRETGWADSGCATRWPARPGEAQYEWEPPRVVASSRVSNAQVERRGSATRSSEGRDEPDDAGEDCGVDCPASISGGAEPALGIDADGLPPGLPRWRRAALQAIGNAVVPQVAEIVARRVKEILSA